MEAGGMEKEKEKVKEWEWWKEIGKRLRGEREKGRRSWRKKSKNEEGGKKKRKRREGDSSEYLMGSGGVYRSTRQCSLFHLVIQLFSHLVDVVSPCERSGRWLRPPVQILRVESHSKKTHERNSSAGATPKRRRSDAGLQTGKIGGFSRFRCVFIH